MGPGSNELLESTAQEDEERRALDKRKCLALNRRCKDIEQVCASSHMHAYKCVRVGIWVMFGCFTSFLNTDY